MEENNNLTAERSLEIITKQIEQSRRAVSKTLGQELFIAGIATMATAVLVAIVNISLMNVGMVGLGHLLWFLLPFLDKALERILIKERAHAPASFVGSMVAKTWATFGIFALGFFVIALLWGFISSKFLTLGEYSVHQMRVAPIIVLMMGMAVTLSGFILKRNWLVWFGVVAGLLCFVWEHLQIGTWLLVNTGELHAKEVGAVVSTMPCLTFFMFAAIGLLLPGLLLKKEAA